VRAAFRVTIVLFAVMLAIASAWADDVIAPSGQRWVAIASSQDLDAAIGIARLYSRQHPQVVKAKNDWYAVIIGPTKATDMGSFRATYNKDGLDEALPSDALLNQGSGYIASAWKPEPITYSTRQFSATKPGLVKYKDITVLARWKNDNDTKRHLEISGDQSGSLLFSLKTDSEELFYEHVTGSIGTVRLDPSTRFPQFIVTYFTGGAHCCTETWIVTEKENRWLLVKGEMLDGDGYLVEDVEGSGNFDLVSLDNSFLYAFESYAGSAAPLRYQQLRGDKISRVFTPAVERRIVQELSGMEFQARLQPVLWNSNGFLGAWVAVKAQLGQADDAWAKMLTSYDRNSEWLMQICRTGASVDNCAQGDLQSLSFPDALARHLRASGYPLPSPQGEQAAPAAPPAALAKDKTDYSVGAYINRGQANLTLAKYDEAISDFSQALKLDPSNASAYLSRGRAFAAKGAASQAVSDFKDAVRLSAETDSTHGAALNELSKTETAAADVGSRPDAKGTKPDASPTPAEQEKRVALVIGNSAYHAVPVLANPENDANDVAASLQSIGFDVTHLDNADAGEMRRALQTFEDKAAGAAIAIIFFAGHGIEVDGTNYLIPVDAELARATHVQDEAVPLSRALAAVEGATKLRLVLIDACRSNPFVSKLQALNPVRAISRGLARVEPNGSTLVSFSAKEGTVAEDGTGRNSPYTAALLHHLATPGLEINFLFRQVHDDVLAATHGEQEPYVYGALGSTPIYLAGQTEQAAGKLDVEQPAGGISTSPSVAFVMPTFWIITDPALVKGDLMFRRYSIVEPYNDVLSATRDESAHLGLDLSVGIPNSMFFVCRSNPKLNDVLVFHLPEGTRLPGIDPGGWISQLELRVLADNDGLRLPSEYIRGDIFVDKVPNTEHDLVTVMNAKQTTVELGPKNARISFFSAEKIGAVTVNALFRGMFTMPDSPAPKAKKIVSTEELFSTCDQFKKSGTF
jgi:tetratricopeptide (TPR) repeat protein